VPTPEEEPRFTRDWQRLTRQQQQQFLNALRVFLRCLREQQFEPSLRVKRVKGRPDVWELSWAPNGRATFTYGEAMQSGDTHIIWRRIGTHGIFREP
jgi:mRNA-degrading endonuclease YafQ of YafQ-DinJ toxin-antitoxin module